MRAALRRATVFLLFGLMVAAAGSGVAKAIEQLEHACCERAAGDDVTRAPTPCRGFLPLSCCQAAALPGSEAPPAPQAAILLACAPLEPLLSTRAIAAASAAPIPRASPLRLSVVLQL